MLLFVVMLDLRDCLASLDPSATRFGFCDRGVELASLIHVSAHGEGAPPGLGRKAKRWLREANKRLEVWQVDPRTDHGLAIGCHPTARPRPPTHSRSSIRSLR